MSLALNTKHLSSFINEEEYKAIYPQVEAAHKTLEAKNGPGSDFLGWMYLPRDYDKEEFERIKAAAARIREDSDVLVVAGIGGSYLGARAVIEAVKGMYHNELDNGLKIYFCGNSISPTYLNDIIALCKGKRFSIAISMAFELAAYGAVSGWLYRRVKHTLPMTYATLAAAMVAGRLVWGAVRFVLAGLSGSSFPFSAFLSGALFTAVPGIIAQLVLIPLIITALQKAKVLE